MTFEIREEAGGSGVLVTLSGLVDGAQCLDINRRIYDREGKPLLRYQIWDFSAVSRLEISLDELHAALIQDRTEEYHNPGGVMAFVSSRSLVDQQSGSFALFKRWVGLSMGSAVFGSLARARAWVLEQVPDIDQDAGTARPLQR